MRLVVPITVRWADLDAYGHVNNAAMLHLLEEARVAVFWHGRHLPEDSSAGRASRVDTATFVAHQEIEYLAPLGYPTEPIPVSLWISKLGGASVEVCYEVPTLDGGTAARARTTIVMMDTASGRPRRISDDERALWSRFTDEPVRFRRG
jgi:acyl-CoA thioester hydrolase